MLPLFGYTSSELIGRNISQLIPLIHQSTNEENPTVAEPPPTIYKYSADVSSLGPHHNYQLILLTERAKYQKAKKERDISRCCKHGVPVPE